MEVFVPISCSCDTKSDTMFVAPISSPHFEHLGLSVIYIILQDPCWGCSWPVLCLFWQILPKTAPSREWYNLFINDIFLFWLALRQLCRNFSKSSLMLLRLSLFGLLGSDALLLSAKCRKFFMFSNRFLLIILATCS